MSTGARGHGRLEGLLRLLPVRVVVEPHEGLQVPVARLEGDLPVAHPPLRHPRDPRVAEQVGRHPLRHPGGGRVPLHHAPQAHLGDSPIRAPPVGEEEGVPVRRVLPLLRGLLVAGPDGQPRLQGLHRGAQQVDLVVLPRLRVPNDGLPAVQVDVLDVQPADLGLPADLEGEEGHDGPVQGAVRRGPPEDGLHLLPAQDLLPPDLRVRGLQVEEDPLRVDEAVRPAEAVHRGHEGDHGVVGVPLRDGVLPLPEVGEGPAAGVLPDLGGGLEDLPQVAGEGGPGPHLGHEGLAEPLHVGDREDDALPGGRTVQARQGLTDEVEVVGWEPGPGMRSRCRVPFSLFELARPV